MRSFSTPFAIFAGSIRSVEAIISGCECLNSHGGFSATGGRTKDNVPYSSLAGIATYGLGSCQSWDNDLHTPYYDSCHLGAAGNDFCGDGSDFDGKGNWCALPWCYVNPSTCPSSQRVKSDVFHPQDMWYSYTTCGVPDCYTGWTANAYTGQCPYTDTSEVDASKCTSCECLGAVTENILSVMKETGYRQQIRATGYGSSCDSWDEKVGTPFHDEFCKGDVDQCKDDNWCFNDWCYVNPKTCVTAVKTTVMAPSSATFSYAACNSPDCYSNVDASGCPHDPDGTLMCFQLGNAMTARFAVPASLVGLAAAGVVY